MPETPETLAGRSQLGRPRDDSLAARRRAEITAAAAPFFAQHGYRHADIEELARGLGIGKGTIYRYFPSKEALFLATVDAAMIGLKEGVDAGTRGIEDPLEQVRAAVHAYLAFFDERPEYVDLFIQERAEFKYRDQPTYFEHRDANIGRWEGLLQRLMAEGRVRAVPATKITNVLSDLLYGTIFSNYFADRRASFGEQAQDILDILLHGILSDAERSGADV